MQFFKDWNLAGMAYIQVASGSRTVQFRRPLPATIRRKQIARRTYPPTETAPVNSGNQTESCFLVSNTPEDYTSAMMQEDEGGCIGAFKKETSCDVEVDISVRDILNVFDVMTSLPDEWEERQKIHWRAVPSLREVWSQERLRMAKLLKPEDDFLSGGGAATSNHEPPPFTLNVKKGASLPGAALALQGMRQLVRVSDGLEESFQRSMKQILARHSELIDRNDASLRQRLNGQDLTPSYDDAMEALGALGGLFGDNSSHNCDKVKTRQMDLSQDSTSTSSSDRLSLNSREFISLSQAFHAHPQDTFPDDGRGTVHEEFAFSQKIDQGDAITTGPFHTIDDVIDPATLAPYEFVDDLNENYRSDEDEETMDEARLEIMLSTMATQSLIPNKDVIGSDDEESTDSNTRLPSQRNSHDEDYDILRGDNDDNSDCTAVAGRVYLKNDSSAMTREAKTLPLLDVSVQKAECVAWKHPPDAWIQPCESPPTRSELIHMTSFTSFFPMSLKGTVASWTTYMERYESICKSATLSKSWFPRVRSEGIILEPVSSAPSAKVVRSWYKKRKRLNLTDGDKEQGRKRASNFYDGTNQEMPNLCIDDNSRATLTDANQGSRNVDEIEEVEWKSNQHGGLSATQHGDTPSQLQGKESSQLRRESQDPSESDRSGGTISYSTPSPDRSLRGIGNQGGRIWVEGGGQLKARMKQSQPSIKNNLSDPNRQHLHDSPPSPVYVMALEIHIQCRTGRAGVHDSRDISMTPDSQRDNVSSIVYVYGKDPGGGESFQVLERACLFVPVTREVEQSDPSHMDRFGSSIRKSMPSAIFGVDAPFSVECIRDERQLLLRIASIVRLLDPDMLLSWDTQGSGIGYLIERGGALGKNNKQDQTLSREIDMARLLGRTPTVSARYEVSRLGALPDSSNAASALFADVKHAIEQSKENTKQSEQRWKGSGMGHDWDDRVGAGAAAASIVRLFSKTRP
jgi:hypothetical protein